MSKIPNNRSNIEQKLRERTIIDEDTKCWLWQGGKTSDGYGEISYFYNVIRIHRLSAHLYLDLDLTNPNEQALHKLNCPNRNCWNPEHLYIGSNINNVNDRINNNLIQKTVCNYGHILDGTKSNGNRYCKTCNNIRNKRYITKSHLIESDKEI